ERPRPAAIAREERHVFAILAIDHPVPHVLRLPVWAPPAREGHAHLSAGEGPQAMIEGPAGKLLALVVDRDVLRLRPALAHHSPHRSSRWPPADSRADATAAGRRSAHDHIANADAAAKGQLLPRPGGGLHGERWRRVL